MSHLATIFFLFDEVILWNQCLYKSITLHFVRYKSVMMSSFLNKTDEYSLNECVTTFIKYEAI